MDAPFRSVLIANRGEIAVRVITACREQGVRAIAVYSEADRDAAHVRAADEAYSIGPAPARESYLNIEAILAAARASGAEAIHPGYGFLSENADFAAACVAAGIVFIGPPAEAIRLMGSKTAAKRAVEMVGVPTVPGYLGGGEDEARDLATLRREARRIGYPLLIKAAAGGGGRGMREVRAAGEFEEALAGAQREALAAFGDDTVFLEKLLIAPRHIEMQILADTHGAAVYLGERECSIQRRHQKVIEESPSVALTPELRAAMGEAAVRAARAAGYVNAGTCEFLLDAEGRYYFLEMNTRLQVEHPVTELVTGLDLVRQQLRIAAGEPLGFTQDDITLRGHAIEARVYAEDSARGYLPSAGRVLVFAPPVGPGVRVDAGVAAGDEVGVEYDAMLAKLIVYGEDRPAAIDRLRRALDDFAALGVTTNIPLLRAIAADASFQAGETTTAFLASHALDAQRESAGGEPPAEALLAAALWEAASPQRQPMGSASKPFNPWTGGATATGSERRFHYSWRGAAHGVTLTPALEGEGYRAALDGEPAPLGVVAADVAPDGEVTLALGARRERLYVARRGYELLVVWRGETWTLEKPRPLEVERAAASGGAALSGRLALTAPMAGTLLKVNVAEGDAVAAQQTVAVLGAMKMEHAIVAPVAGRVTRVTRRAGEVVPGGETLVELESGE